MTGILLSFLYVVSMLIQMVQLVVLLSVIISWVGADPSNPLVSIVHQMTEPMYRPIRALTSRFTGPVDISPMVIILIVVFLQQLIHHWSRSMSY